MQLHEVERQLAPFSDDHGRWGIDEDAHFGDREIEPADDGCCPLGRHMAGTFFVEVEADRVGSSRRCRGGVASSRDATDLDLEHGGMVGR